MKKHKLGRIIASSFFLVGEQNKRVFLGVCGLWKKIKTRVQKTSIAFEVKKNVLTYMWEDKKTRKSEKASTTAQQPIPSQYSTFCGRSGWWWGGKAASRQGLSLRVGKGLTLSKTFQPSAYTKEDFSGCFV